VKLQENLVSGNILHLNQKMLVISAEGKILVNEVLQYNFVRGDNYAEPDIPKYTPYFILQIRNWL
jgi:hypothetical protein